MAPSTRSAYNGTARKLIIAVDLGTTYSGVSYCILNPGLVPEVKNVTRYPAQEGIGGDSRIPTVIIYNPAGQVVAVGAEADQNSIRERMEDENLLRLEWFKLHLRPKDLHAEISTDLPPLPPGKTIISVYADFLRYIVDCARRYISDVVVNGAAIWNSAKEFVLTHPNGWGGPQQAQMRDAAVQAGLVSDTPAGRESVHFVTEGEASLHYCVSNNIMQNQLQENDRILVLDAGGGTVDASEYKKNPQNVATYEEIAAPQCYLQGAVFVTQRASLYLQNYFNRTKWKEDVPEMAKIFDKTTKLRFKDPAEAAYIKFGTMRDRDPELNIRNGQLKLDGSIVAKFFDPSVQTIQNIIDEAFKKNQIKIVFFVGGFASNEYLFRSLKAKFDPMGVAIYRPDNQAAKAVADGAVSYYLDNYVRARIAKHTFGYICNGWYDPNDAEFVARKSKIVVGADGVQRIPNFFDVILPKDTKVTEDHEYRRTYIRSDYTLANLKQSVVERISAYYGPLARPRWAAEENMDTDYRTMCSIPVDMTTVSHLMQQRTNSSGGVYYAIDYEIVLLLGLTELKAQICWKENGQEKRTNATLIYDTD